MCVGIPEHMCVPEHVCVYIPEHHCMFKSSLSCASYTGNPMKKSSCWSTESLAAAQNVSDWRAGSPPVSPQSLLVSPLDPEFIPNHLT